MTHSLLDFDKEFIEWTFFVEKIIASALEPTIGMLFTKRMIVVALMISLFPPTSTGHKWSSMKVLYSNYTEYRPKKITPLKKTNSLYTSDHDNLSSDLPLHQVNLHTSVQSAGHPLLLSNMQKPTVNSQNVTKVSRTGHPFSCRNAHN